ncbi:MAG: rhomboid family intramembrane serine protease [Cyanothece sp. SIO1E1]|nr:rhomboid family intramembrane serine protease [Cyanothece sp. SIO1E1]
MSKQETGAIARELKSHFFILGGFAALLWGLEIVDLLLGGALNRFGIRPRSLDGLWGILWAPLLHGNFGHLMANTVPLLVLGWFVMLRETTDFFVVTLITMVVGGLGTWLLGHPNSIHIGASGLVFGYFGFLLLRGYFERSIVSMIFSAVVMFLYGGLLWGVLPSQPGISWEGHLFGFLGGILAARLLARSKVPV